MRKVIGYAVAQYFDTYFEHWVSQTFEFEDDAKKHKHDKFTNNCKTTYHVRPKFEKEKK